MVTVKVRPDSAEGPSALEERLLKEGPMALVGLMREGVPWDLFQDVLRSMDLTDLAGASALHIPARTLARRKGGRLDSQESERLLRLVRLVAQAADVLGDRGKALRWLRAPNRALAGTAPIALLDTDIGTQAAEAVLTRIAHGVFS